MIEILSSRQQVLQILTEAKAKGGRIIDLGGGLNPWADSFIDAYVDINEASVKGKKVYSLDLNLITDSMIPDKYDFALCSHTIEDLRNPYNLLTALPLIARRGVIIIPSVFKELSYVESADYLGYYHHRWIGTVEDQRLLLYPKLHLLHSFYPLSIPRHHFKIPARVGAIISAFLFKKRFKTRSAIQHKDELIIYWQDQLQFAFLNRDYPESIEQLSLWYHQLPGKSC